MTTAAAAAERTGPVADAARPLGLQQVIGYRVAANASAVLPAGDLGYVVTANGAGGYRVVWSDTLRLGGGVQRPAHHRRRFDPRSCTASPAPRTSRSRRTAARSPSRRCRARTSTASTWCRRPIRSTSTCASTARADGFGIYFTGGESSAQLLARTTTRSPSPRPSSPLVDLRYNRAMRLTAGAPDLPASVDGAYVACAGATSSRSTRRPRTPSSPRRRSTGRPTSPSSAPIGCSRSCAATDRSQLCGYTLPSLEPVAMLELEDRAASCSAAVGGRALVTDESLEQPRVVARHQQHPSSTPSRCASRCCSPRRRPRSGCWRRRARATRSSSAGIRCCGARCSGSTCR